MKTKLFKIIILIFLCINISCNTTKSDKDAESETNLLLLLAARGNSSSSPINSISYIGRQSGNPGSTFGFATNVTISSITPSIIGATPINYSINSTLPTGLSFDTNTGTISGTPTSASTQSAFTVTARYSGTSESKNTVFFTMVNASISNLTCNQSGIFAGCTGVTPYSCSNSNVCYSTLSGCRNSSFCASF
jgi:hypothetical protein